jgi:hypothetical protein
MQMSAFWNLVELARTESDQPDLAGSGPVADALVRRLGALPLDEIVQFQLCYERAIGHARRWELCAAAYLVWNYVSDDAFKDFRGGLVALGRESFVRITADPDTLAVHPLVRAIARGEADPDAFAGESIEAAAARAYGAHTGDDEDFYLALDAQPGPDEPDEPDGQRTGERWSGTFAASDVERIPDRLPELHALFAGRTSTDA